MAAGNRKLLFTNCIVWTGEIGSAARREVLVEGKSIVEVSKTIPQEKRAGAVVVDLGGATLMPGLIDGHSHLSFLNTRSTVEFGFLPVEEHIFATMANAQKVLLAGFTSCIGAASAKPRLDIAVRDAIKSGQIPGPRLLAATQEITVTGGVADERRLHMYLESTGAIVDGPDEVRRYVRTMCREGVDVIKLNLSGSLGFSHCPADATVMTEAEIEAATAAARAMNKRLASHSHSAQGVKLSIKHGIELIHHCTLADEEAIDLIEAHRDEVFLAPAIGNVYAMLYEAAELGIPPEMVESLDLKSQFESSVRVYSELRKRGARVLLGGDYGFAWNPHGRNARDLEMFVRFFGYSPEEALRCATANGALAMRMADRIGSVKPGYLADLVVVRGRPFEDVSAMRAENIALVLTEGRAHGPSAPRIDLAAHGDTVALH